jgi:hypothetical protein
MPPQIFSENLLPRSNPSPSISARARMEPLVQEPRTKNLGENNPIRARNRGFEPTEPKIFTPIHLKRFRQRDEPGQISRAKKTQSSAPQKPRKIKVLMLQPPPGGISSDVGRPPIVKSTALQQGLG